MVTCPAPGTLVEERIDRILTWARESPHLLGVIRHDLGQIEEVIRVICSIPEYFDLNTAIGDQLTLIGKRLGWPREHCVCTIAPVFGFDCGGTYTGQVPVVGFCEPGSTWIGCLASGVTTVRIDDDEVYRGYLRARRYQMLGMYDVESLTAALGHVWGPTAMVVEAKDGEVVVAPFRALTAQETTLLPVTIRVLPIAPGIKALVHLGSSNIFGFGTGWGGFCDVPAAEWLCPIDPHAYDCA